VLSDKFFEIALIGPFGNDDKLIVMDEGINVLNDVGMVEGFHQVDLLEAFFALFLVGHVKNLIRRRGTLIFLRAKVTAC
jgi:hypothetical protein